MKEGEEDGRVEVQRAGQQLRTSVQVCLLERTSGLLNLTPHIYSHVR